MYLVKNLSSEKKKSFERCSIDLSDTLREFNCKFIFEQVTPTGVQENRKELGGRSAPRVSIGPKSAGFNRVKKIKKP